MAPTTSTINFPIGDLGDSVPTKPIPLASLPSFHGLVSEDPDTFLFEFDIVCRGCDYMMDAQKLKNFPSTLKGMALRWFMGLRGSSISTWDGMQTTFLEKYQDYCKYRNIKEEIFKFTQKEDESLEYCVEQFKYTLQRSGHSNLDKEILKIILLRSFREDAMELLNIVGKGYISKESFKVICELCIQCLRGLARNRQGIRSTKGSGGGVTKAEIRKLLDNLRTDILSTLLVQMDTLQVKQKLLELDRTMAIFFPKCRKKHPERECPLNSIEECAICELNHATSSCPSLPGLKALFQGTGEDT